MKRAHATLLPALLAQLIGCGTTVKVLPDSLDCPVLPERLSAACAAPQALPDGASFEQLIRASIQDGQALQVCEKRRADLAESVRICNKAVADHLARLRELNQANQAPR
ncbi:MAG: hypothetical protein QE285_03260 [Aquabacterium sp.]|nr:hypothetical protein [Aquabacterium sp.]